MPTDPLGNPTSRKPSAARKYALLAVFCLAQFIDALSITALFSAMPSLVISLEMTAVESSWIISAFTLTFASFLLVSGRISDVYDPKSAFVVGLCSLAFISLGEGFVKKKVTLIILRAVSGIAASLTIPSALALLSRTFTDPAEQARAIGIFGGCGAVGDILGLVVGAVFVDFVSIDGGWRWVFWNLAMVAFLIAMVSVILVPSHEPPSAVSFVPKMEKFKSFDIVGVSVLTVSLILFIFSITSGPAVGWKSTTVLIPSVISVVLMGCFFYWESLIPAGIAAIPPKTWFYRNFTVLFTLGLLPFFWWSAVFMAFGSLWQDVYRWTAISSATHLVPLGVVALIVGFTGSLSTLFNPKWILVSAQVALLVGTTLLCFADRPDKYWTLVFPAFLIGSAGSMLTYTHANIAIFRTAPLSMRGTVSAIFNGALQLGSAIGISAVTAIQVSVDAKSGRVGGYDGRAAGFWFIVGIICVEAVAVLFFYRDEAPEVQATVVVLEDAMAAVEKPLAL